jgi:hypothetical protein
MFSYLQGVKDAVLFIAFCYNVCWCSLCVNILQDLCVWTSAWVRIAVVSDAEGNCTSVRACVPYIYKTPKFRVFKRNSVYYKFVLF